MLRLSLPSLARRDHLNRLAETVSIAAPFPRCPQPWQTPAPLSVAPTVRCVPVPSNSSDWRIELCYQAGRCNVGYVRVTYLDEARCEDVETQGKASLDAEQDEWVKRTLGPHTLAVFFDGPARFGLEQPEGYAGGCSYTYPFELNNGGTFLLRVVLVYDVHSSPFTFELWDADASLKDYRGLDSVHQNSWQPIINQELTESAFVSPPDACPSSCRRYVHEDTTLITPGLPLCHRDAPIHGSWLPTFQLSISEPPFSYGVFPAYLWAPADCRLSTTSIDYLPPANQRAQCFGRRQRVMFTGDSHIRWMYDGFIRKMHASFMGEHPAEARYVSSVVGF